MVTQLLDLGFSRYLKEGLGLVSYTQSDCHVPCGRDLYVQELMKEMTVDSYGSCLHNKDLPKQ